MNSSRGILFGESGQGLLEECLKRIGSVPVNEALALLRKRVIEKAELHHLEPNFVKASLALQWLKLDLC
jgi:hypothetical protein